MEKVVVSLKAQSFQYSFAEDGGAIGSIDTGIFIPENSIITRCLCRVKSSFASMDPSATVGISVGGLTIVAPLVLSSWPTASGAPALDVFVPVFSLTADLISGAVTGSINNDSLLMTPTAAQSNVTFDIGTGALVNGIAQFIIEYYESAE